MKNTMIYLGTAIGVLTIALIFSNVDINAGGVRYHQHKEEPSEEELGQCYVCGGEGELCTHLPIVRIDTGGQKIPGAAILDEKYNTIGYETGSNGEEEILAEISTVEASGIWHHGDDEADMTVSAMVRYRGDTSRAFSKHGYRVKFMERDNTEQNVKVSFLGMSEESEWALHGPFLDKTLLRNYMWMNLSAEIMGYAPNVRFCELIVDGEYQGLYVLMETISESEGRVDLTDYENGSPVCSYILQLGTEMDAMKTIDNFSHYTNRLEESGEIEIIYPTKQYQSDLVKNYICSDFSEIERIIYSAEMYDDSQSWRDVIDMDSFVNYYILQEFLMVNDAFAKSTYFYRDVRGKLHIGPVWDYNNVLDNFFRPIPSDEFIIAQKGWYTQLMTDEEFVEAVIRRYHELRKGVLSEEYLNQYIDETIQWLGSAIDRNYEIWGYGFEIANLNRTEYRQPSKDDIAERTEASKGNAAILDAWMMEACLELNPKSYEEAIEQMRDCISARGDWLDDHIDVLRQYCTDSKKAPYIVY